MGEHRGSLGGEDDGAMQNRSPRGSIGPVSELDRSPRGSLAGQDRRLPSRGFGAQDSTKSAGEGRLYFYSTEFFFLFFF